MTIHLTEASRERALSERARWVGLRLDVVTETSTHRTYRIVDPMSGLSLSHPGADTAELDIDGAEAVIDLHSKPTQLGD